MSFAYLTFIAIAVMASGFIPLADESVYLIATLATLALAGSHFL